MTKLIHADETHALLGACFEVYKEKGADFWRQYFRNAWKSNSLTAAYLSKRNRR